VRPSKSRVLDQRALAIVRAASPFGPFSAAMRQQADQIVITSRFRFTRDDGLETFLLNLVYAGKLQAMPAKYTTDDGRFEVIRPLIGCAEKTIAEAQTVVGRLAAEDMSIVMAAKGRIEVASGELGTLQRRLAAGLGEVACGVRQFESQTADAVRSLQFEDIVRQTTEHVELRVQAVEAASQALGSALEGLSGGLGGGDPERIEAHTLRLQEVSAALARLRPAPATQSSVRSGDIELF